MWKTKISDKSKRPRVVSGSSEQNVNKSNENKRPRVVSGSSEQHFDKQKLWEQKRSPIPRMRCIGSPPTGCGEDKDQPSTVLGKEMALAFLF